MKVGEIWKHKHTGKKGIIKLIKQKISDELDHEIFIKWMDKEPDKEVGEFINSGIFIEAFEREE